jgi:hypothetical protein
MAARRTASDGQLAQGRRRNQAQPGVSQGGIDSKDRRSRARTQEPVFGEGMAFEEAEPARKVFAAGEARRDTWVREAVVRDAIPAKAAGAGPREREGMGLEHWVSACEHRAVSAGQ